MRGRYTDPWQTLYFRPDPHGHGSFRPGLADPGMVDERCRADQTASEARIVFTMGCHSGLSVPNGTGATNATDWAEVYGAARAVYVGNTGYGYGDTATVALTEQLMANLAANLDGTLTIGQALTQAKQDQFGRAGLYGVYDLKAIEEATLYGLPMWAVDVDGGPPVELPAVGPVTSEPVSGLEAAQFSVEPTFQQVDSAVGTYFAADGETQFLHWRPIQPRLSVDATQDGKVATGVLLTDLETRDVTVGDAAFARPTTTSGSAREPEVETAGVVFPSTFAQIGTSTRLGPDGPAREHLRDRDPEALQALFRPDALHVKRDNQEDTKPVFSPVGERLMAVWRHDHTSEFAPDEDTQRAVRLVLEFTSDPANVVTFTLARNQIFVEDNLSVLHGRTSFPADVRRKLNRVNFLGDAEFARSRITFGFPG
jgi:hypothetical protein